MRIFAFAIYLLVCPIQAHAQGVSFNADATTTCLAATDNIHHQHDCIDESANDCIGDSAVTPVERGCWSSGLAFWDERLNAAYAALRAEDPAMADHLRDAQRAWIPYRDAKCEFEMATWGNGTGGPGALVQCLMQSTGERALDLETRLHLVRTR